jgi:hypothetical protein
MPLVATGLNYTRAATATSYLAGRFRSARMEAVKRGAATGIRFESARGGHVFSTYVDGNGDGIRSSDIADGTDAPIGSPERIDDSFPGVSFAVAAGVVDIDSGGALPPGDGVRIGRAAIMTFTPEGSSSSGTVYVMGRGGEQFAVRVAGATGRTRVLAFNPAERQWTSR